MRYILSLDVETNGLHGSIFAIGAVLIKCNSDYTHTWVTGEFFDAAAPSVEIDDWVEANVIPKLVKKVGKPMNTWQSGRNLLRKFAKFYKEAMHKNAEVVVFCPYPCEASFFRDLFNLGLIDEREHPCPMYDLATLLHYEGCKDPASVEANYEAITCKKYDNKRAHDPMYDAETQLDVYLKLMQNKHK
jgi:hypothetical protein